jgi:hypothetical protein
VAADDARPLADVLGPPAAFADELRTSAGLPPAPAAATTGTTAAAATPPGDPGEPAVPAAAVRVTVGDEGAGGDDVRFGAGAAADPGGTGERPPPWQAVADHRWTREVRDFLPELRPAWWVARGLLATWLLGEITDGDPFHLFGSRVLWVLVAALLVVASVRWSRDREPTRTHRMADIVAGFAAALAVAAVWTGSGTTSGPEAFADTPTPVEPVVADGGVVHADGRPITNIVPYGPDGEPLEDVFLYDQDGQPIEIGDFPVDAEGRELTTDHPLDVDGREVRNAYPLDQRATTWDPEGVERRERVAPLQVVPPELEG